MLDLATIKAMNREAGIRAAETNQTPYVYYNLDEVDELVPFPFPNLGDHRPDGWELVDQLFVDKSGLGQPDEPALTAEQLITEIKSRIRDARTNRDTLGWAIIEEGEFQLYVGVFRRV
jgi:hypothetical protein